MYGTLGLLMTTSGTGTVPESRSSATRHINLGRSEQESPLREIRTVGLKRRGLETGLRFG